jgi:hypothetical protein
VDSGELHIAALAMLDLSAAFNTVDHETLFSHLKESYGLTSVGDSSLFVAEVLHLKRPR